MSRHCRDQTREADIRPFSRFLLAAYFLETGLLLLVVPWSGFWERNYFVTVLPWLEVWLTNSFVRGAISGVGLVSVGAGVAEFGSLVLGRLRSDSRTLTADPPGHEP